MTTLTEARPKLRKDGKPYVPAGTYKGMQCSIAWCTRRAHARGVCKPHYQRILDGRSLNSPIQIIDRSGQRKCTIPDCGRKYYCSGYCRTHYQRVRHHGHPGGLRLKWTRLASTYSNYQSSKRLMEQEIAAGRPKADACEICGSISKIVYEHDHKTGRFRGWACAKCNSALGFAEDDPVRLRAMAAYLEKHMG